MYEAFAEATKTITSAISSGVARRLTRAQSRRVQPYFHLYW